MDTDEARQGVRLLATENEQLPLAFGQALGSRGVLLRGADHPGLLLVQGASQARARASKGRPEAAHGPQGSAAMSFAYAPRGPSSSRGSSRSTMEAPAPAPRQVHANYLRVLDAAADVLDGSAAALERKASELEAAGRAIEAETLKRTARDSREESSRTRAEIAKTVAFRAGAA
jgi:hypothetical protein